MTALANPFPLLSDTSARLIDGGFVYIGLPDLDPEANPKPVFWDEARTVPAEQPLRTIAGYIVRDGTPARAYIDGAHSIRVRQANGAVVYTDLDVGDDALGATDILFVPTGPNPTPRPTSEKLSELGMSIADYGARTDATRPVNTAAFAGTFNELVGVDNVRGQFNIPRGRFELTMNTIGFPDALGLRVSGASQLGTQLRFDGSAGYGMTFGPVYEYAVIENMAIVNQAVDRGTTVGVRLDCDLTGSKFHFENVSIAGWAIGVGIFDPAPPFQNGDTNIFNRCDFDCTIAFDMASSTQAVINLLHACSFSCRGCVVSTNGSAETSIVKANIILGDDVFQFGPSAGGQAGRVRLLDSKLEYHFPDRQRRIVFCSATVVGNPIRVTVADTVLAGGNAQPANRDTHTIVENAGAALAVDINRCDLPGAIGYRTTQPCDVLRWNMTDNEKAPMPSAMSLRRAPALNSGGIGFPLFRWSGNENVPDQYRGGQLGARWGDATKFYAWRTFGDALLNTGVDNVELETGKFGKNFTLPGLPAHTSQLRLAVWLDGSSAPNIAGGGSPAALEVTQFTDATFTTVVGAPKVIPAGSRGLKTVHLEDHELGDGNLYVRLTSTAGQVFRGGVVVFYFPWVEHPVEA